MKQRNVVFAEIDIVEFVGDFPNDLLDNVLNRDQTGDRTKLVNHQSHVVTRDAEVTQDDVQRLGFGNKSGRTKMGSNVVRRIHKQTQQVLCVQHALNLVQIAFDDGEAGVSAADDLGKPNLSGFF